MASFEKIIAGESSIQDYIPQRPPMVMVGKLLEVEGRKTVTSLLVKEENIFCEGGRMLEPGLIENIAQTAAAGAGYRSSLNNQPPPPGFIGAVKNLVIHHLPAVGDEIETEVTVEHEILGATVISGKITSGGTPVAECEMKIFAQNA